MKAVRRLAWRIGNFGRIRDKRPPTDVWGRLIGDKFWVERCGGLRIGDNSGVSWLPSI